jgi:DnaK suppressor protein
VDLGRAQELIDTERAEAQRALTQLTGDETEARDTRDEDLGDEVDTAQELDSLTVDDTVADGLRDKLAALDRAEQRIKDGTYGRSVRSGDVIPDARLEADPAAELTVEEQAADERNAG